jgi:ABC-type branched-subunit amino acid transport system substrate-binding protein
VPLSPTNVRRGRIKILSMALLGFAAAVAIAACGSSNSSNTSSNSSSTSSSSSSGSSSKPIKIMGLGTFQATVAYPEAPPAFKSEVKAINEAGGIHGRHLELTICNDQGSPEVAAHCARQAVEQGDVAVMGSYSVQAAAFLPILEAAHIPYVGADATQSVEGTSPISFPLESQYQLYASMGYAAGYKGCKTAALITENYGAATLTEDKTADKGFEAASKGGKVVKRIEVGTTNTTYAPQVAAMLQAGAECIIAPLPPDEFPKLFASIEQSSKPNTTVGSTAASVPSEILKTLGKKADRMIIGSAAYIPGSLEEPKPVAEAIEGIKKIEPSGEINTFSVAGVAAVKIVAHVIEEVKGEVTPSAVLEGMGKLENYETGIAAPFTTTKPGPIAGQPRIHSMNILVYEVINGKEKLASKGFIDLSPSLAG